MCASAHPDVAAAIDYATKGATAGATALAARFGADSQYVFATYTVKLADGSVYSGRTSASVNAGESHVVAARRAVADRWSQHHMRASAPPRAGSKLDAYVAGALRKGNLVNDGVACSHELCGYPWPASGRAAARFAIRSTRLRARLS